MDEVGDAPFDELALLRQAIEQRGSGAAPDHGWHELDDRPAGQPGGVQLLDQLDLVHSALGVVPLAARAALRVEQVLLLVVAQGPDTDAGTGGEFTDADRASSMASVELLDSDVNVRF